MEFTQAQSKALSIVPHFSALLSALGSSWIFFEVLRDQKKRKKPYYRLLFTMSSFDILSSIWYGLSTWPIPANTEGVFGASGTLGSCTAQGFFIEMSIIVPVYNSMLSVYYFLVIRNGMSEKKFLTKVEPYMHAVAVIFSLGVSFAGVGLDLYNNADVWCWIARYPVGCQTSAEYGSDGTCTRGDNAFIYRWALFYGPLWFLVLVVMILMSLVWYSLYRQEMTVLKYDVTRQVRRQGYMEKMKNKKSRKSFKMSQEVAKQAVCYVGAFYITWIAATVNRILQEATGKQYFAAMLCHVIFTPMQGFFNFLVYMRPRFRRWKKEKKASKKANARNEAAKKPAEGKIEHESCASHNSDSPPVLSDALVVSNPQSDRGQAHFPADEEVRDEWADLSVGGIRFNDILDEEDLFSSNDTRGNKTSIQLGY